MVFLRTISGDDIFYGISIALLLAAAYGVIFYGHARKLYAIILVSRGTANVGQVYFLNLKFLDITHLIIILVFDCSVIWGKYYD